MPEPRMKRLPESSLSVLSSSIISTGWREGSSMMFVQNFIRVVRASKAEAITSGADGSEAVSPPKAVVSAKRWWPM